MITLLPKPEPTPPRPPMIAVAVIIRICRNIISRWKLAVADAYHQFQCSVVPHWYSLERIVAIAEQGRPAPRFVGRVVSRKNVRTGIRSGLGLAA